MAGRRPVLFLPGFPASSLYKGDEKLFINAESLIKDKARILKLLRGPDSPNGRSSVDAGRPLTLEQLIKPFGISISPWATVLYDVLHKRYGYTPFSREFKPVGWDWRRPVYANSTMSRVLTTLQALYADNGNRKVTAIVHSTGGLVLRAFFKAYPGEASAHIDTVVALGIPWAGTLKSLRYLAGEEDFGPLISTSETQRVISYAWAAYDLLPPPPSTEMAGLSLCMRPDGTHGSPLVDDGWMPTDLKPVMFPRAQGSLQELGARSRDLRLPGSGSIQVFNVAGWGYPTDTTCMLAGTGKLLFAPTDDGDGTVPHLSSSSPTDVATFHVPLGIYTKDHSPSKHNGLFEVPGTEDVLDRVFDGAGGPFIQAAVDHDDYFAGQRVRIRMSLQTAQGARLAGAVVAPQGFARKLGEFRPDQAGRLTIDVPRAFITKDFGGQFKRLDLKVRWNTGSTTSTLFIRRA